MDAGNRAGSFFHRSLCFATCCRRQCGGPGAQPVSQRDADAHTDGTSRSSGNDSQGDKDAHTTEGYENAYASQSDEDTHDRPGDEDSDQSAGNPHGYRRCEDGYFHFHSNSDEHAYCSAGNKHGDHGGNDYPDPGQCAWLGAFRQRHAVRRPRQRK